jgi:hypothetical protein
VHITLRNTDHSILNCQTLESPSCFVKITTCDQEAVSNCLADKSAVDDDSSDKEFDWEIRDGEDDMIDTAGEKRVLVTKPSAVTSGESPKVRSLVKGRCCFGAHIMFGNIV